MLVDVDSDRPLIDRERLAWLTDRFVFDDDRRVIGGPDWDEMLEAFASIPMQRVQAPARAMARAGNSM